MYNPSTSPFPYTSSPYLPLQETCAPWHHIDVVVPISIGATTADGQVEVRHVGRPPEAGVAGGSELQDLDLEVQVPRLGRDAVRGAHHAVALGAGVLATQKLPER